MLPPGYATPTFVDPRSSKLPSNAFTRSTRRQKSQASRRWKWARIVQLFMCRGIHAGQARIDEFASIHLSSMGLSNMNRLLHSFSHKSIEGIDLPTFASLSPDAQLFNAHPSRQANPAVNLAPIVSVHQCMSSLEI
mmetsp:Transcript_13328/g.28925  ORF Transcript_13328/g.28925 Transcript_13328/m.28925 type:complete len:136 (+) Transcript_13328:880-1287(+)